MMIQHRYTAEFGGRPVDVLDMGRDGQRYYLTRECDAQAFHEWGKRKFGWRAGLIFKARNTDVGVMLSRHWPHQITWRWSLCLDYIWRRRGFNGKRREPLAFRLRMLLPAVGKGRAEPIDFNSNGSAWVSWLGLSLTASWQPPHCGQPELIRAWLMDGAP